MTTNNIDERLANLLTVTERLVQVSDQSLTELRELRLTAQDQTQATSQTLAELRELRMIAQEQAQTARQFASVLLSKLERSPSCRT